MINKVILIGRLGSDVESKVVGDTNVHSLSVATSDDYFDKKKDEWVNVTDWHRVVKWGRISELKKGDLVYLEGKIKYEKYQDSNGNDKFTTKIIAQFIRKMPSGANVSSFNKNQGGDGLPF